MLLLKVKSLLEDYRMSMDAVSDLVLSDSEEIFDKRVIASRGITAEEFKGKWVTHGFNTTIQQVWGYIIRKHYVGTVVSIVASSVKLSTAEVANNSTALESIIHAVIQRLDSIQLNYGTDLTQLIRREVSEAYSSNRHTYADKFRIKDRDHDVSPALADKAQDTIVTTTDWEKALGPKGITPDEVRIILEDLSETFKDYKLKRDGDEETDDFTMYESFLRTHFTHELEEFNAKFKGLIKVVLPEHTSASKYTKYDELMYRLYKDFIIRGINRDNVDQMQNLIVQIVTGNGFTVTNITAVFGHTSVGGVGRSASKHVLTSDCAVEKYDRLMFGLISLSRLVIALRRAGRSPYEINPAIFTSKIDGVSSKFTTIAQILKYSNTMIEVVDKYGFDKTIGSFKTLKSSKKGTGLIINDTQKNTVIFENRTNRTIDDLSSSIKGIVKAHASSGELISEFPFPIQEWTVNIFTLAKTISKGLSPFLAIGPYVKPILELEDFNPFEDEDFVYDPSIITKTLGVEDFPYMDYTLAREDFDDFVDRLLATIPEGHLAQSKDAAHAIRRDNIVHFAWLLDDLRKGGLDHNVKIILGAYNFIDAFDDFLLDFRNINAGDKVTYVDFATAIYKDKLFAPLHDVLDASKVKSTKDNYKVMLALLKPSYPELTLEQVQEFIGSPVDTPAFEAFKAALYSRTFNSVRNNFISAQAGLFSLTTEGRSVCLTGSDLQEALANKPVVDHYIDEFNDHFANVARDHLTGYLVDSRGFLYQVIDEDNKVGALHSEGVYIFTDKSTSTWK